MNWSPGSPRLLPVTMVALAALLAVKSTHLVRAALPAKAAELSHQTAKAAEPPREAKLASAAPSRPSAPSSAAAPHSAAGAGDKREAVPVTAPPMAAPEIPPIGDSERALLLELRQRRQELDGRSAALAAREAVVAAAERKLESRVDELSALQARLEALERARQSRDEASWRGLVKLYESMRPREAAAIFNDLDMQVLLQVVDRMKEAKAALVMAAMQPEKARQVTAELAQMRARANADPSAAGG